MESSTASGAEENTITKGYNDTPSFDDYLEYQIGIALWKYMSPVVIVVGVIGNILSFLVTRFTRMKRYNFSIYLSALAIFDIGVLVVGLVQQWIFYTFDYDIVSVHEWGCKLFESIYIFTSLSAWMLVCVTIDRVIIVYLPLKAKSICTKNKTIIVICLVTLFTVGLNLHWIFSVGERLYMGELYTCANKEAFEDFIITYWPWIDAAFASFIPFTILVICNILIVVKLLKAGIRRNKQMNASNSNMNDAVKSMTIMLVVISLLFICFTAPIVVDIAIFNLNYDQQLTTTLAEDAHDELRWAIVNMLVYLNSAMNFFMYCLSGKKFRESLKDLFCRRKSAMRKSTYTSRTGISQIKTDSK
ncbi:unnamed protein product [Owenia fusiformis]|uniref:G-protein coupled receptors family 1 profile domain-containing protein n=1 Tax=Owenia fusiformis TaxID=6347 RepID=A0A8S4Q6C3_OWEFU|nr:unnamed protein product [Owenia fusiformis]